MMSHEWDHSDEDSTYKHNTNQNNKNKKKKKRKRKKKTDSDVHKHHDLMSLDTAIKQVTIKNMNICSTLSPQFMQWNDKKSQFIQSNDKKLLILIEFTHTINLQQVSFLAYDETKTEQMSGPGNVSIYKVNDLNINMDNIPSWPLKCSFHRRTDHLFITVNSHKLKYLAICIDSNIDNKSFTFFNSISFFGTLFDSEMQEKEKRKLMTRFNPNADDLLFRPASTEVKNDNDDVDDCKKIEYANYKKLDTFTIDTYGTKKYDDGISIHTEEINDNVVYVIGIHIADVTLHITEEDELNKKIINKNGTINSDDINHRCSLSEGVDRKTISLFMYVDSDGNLFKLPSTGKSIKFVKTEINSLMTLTFDEADELLKTTGYLPERYLLFYNIAEKMLMKNYNGMGTSAKLQFDSKSKNLIEYLMVIYNEKACACIEEHTKNKPKNTYTSPLRKQADRNAQRQLKQYI
eukprot:210559_1